MSDNYLVVGCVTGYYGLKGWVKVKSFTEPQVNILSYKKCFISADKTPHKNWRLVEVENGRQQGKDFVAKFSGFDDRTAVESFGKFQIAICAEDLPELEKDEFYWHELEGLEVWSVEGVNSTDVQLLGKLSHLLETGSNDVLVVKACPGSMDKRERLLPYRPEVVLKVDLASARIDVDWDSEF